MLKNIVKKSLFTFGLLASSLVMLGITPFLNNNAVMAQGYYNYGDSYSQYPTEDKKYECRTGPLEGFFVSSVEFCKFKFDDKDRKDIRDNRTGTQGPPGPSIINTTNVYTVVGNTNTETLSLGLFSSIALCDAGDTAQSGSFVTTGSATIRSDKPLATENGWNATADRPLPAVGPGSVTADVQCFDNPPAHIP